MKNNNTEVKKIAVYGLMIALALVFSYIESQIPAFFAFPGMKLGLTNVVVILALYKLGNTPAMTLNILRIALVSILFGGISAFLYSLAGGMLSTLVMILLKNKFRTVTVSIIGGVAHNIGQILVAMVIMNTSGIAWYLVILWFSGMLSGAVIGLIGSLLCTRLPDNLFFGGNKNEK